MNTLPKCPATKILPHTLATPGAADLSRAVDGHARVTAPSVRNFQRARNAWCIASILVKGLSVVDTLARKTVPQVRERVQGIVPSNVRSCVTMGHVAYLVQHRVPLVKNHANGRVHTFVAGFLALL